MNSILNLQKLSQEIDDITAEALSDKMMSEVKSQEELHNLTIWYPLLTGSRKGMNLAITSKSFLEALILASVNPQYVKRLCIEFLEKYKFTTCCVQKLFVFFCFYFVVNL